MEQPSSNLFEGYKSVGHVTGPLPFIVRHGKNHQDTRIITIIGRTFHTYTTNLKLVEVSIPHEFNISSIISDERHIYSASGRSVLEWARGSRALVQRLDNGHQADVKLMTKTGATRLVSVDEDNVLFNWDLKEKSILNIITFDENTFKITALLHPTQYKDKCLLGSEQGPLQLWNIVTEQCLFKFSGWDSKVTCLAQSPVEDVVGIGLEDGHVYVHNIKYDEVLIKIYQEYGSVTSMTFRLDGKPYLVTGSEVGHLMIWNVERKRLSTQIRNAHVGRISKCQFLRNETSLITSGEDNAVKVWSLDMSDGGGNLLCQRAGHSEPPSHIKFYGSKGFNLLSAGQDSTIKMFHLYSERLNKNLGTARLNPKSKHKDRSINKLPPITCFAAETAKEKQWDNIAACHKDSCLVTTWNYDKCRMGEHIIQQPTFNKHEVFASCICITGCGNFVIIGFSNGLIFKYNLQSGAFRQYYECPKLSDNRAHDGRVTGVTVDGLDIILVSGGGGDSTLRLWNFKSGAMLAETGLSAPIKRLELHRENNLIAVALENNDIEIMDLETRQLVRKFSLSHTILDMTFSPDCRWLIVSYSDRSIRTWDLNLGKMIDAFRLSSACTSMSISSTGEFLATAHEDSLGINIWCNYTIYCPTPLRPIDCDKVPAQLDVPFVRCDEQVGMDEDDQQQQVDEDQHVLADASNGHNDDDAYVSPEQLHDDMITLSGLPSSRWKNLLNIEEIREKQLIEEESRRERPVKVPFFIPVKDGLRPTLDEQTIKELNANEESNGPDNVGKLSKIQELRLLSPLGQCLLNCGKTESKDFSEFLRQLKELGPSATDAEIRSLGKDTCGDIEPMLCFLDAIEQDLSSNVDYELATSWLALFLKAHSDEIQTDPKVRRRSLKLLEVIRVKWDRLNEEFNQIFCVLNFVRSSIL